jgi:integrase
LIYFAAYTGLRAGELVALRVRDLDLGANPVVTSASPSPSWRRSATFAVPPRPSRLEPFPFQSSSPNSSDPTSLLKSPDDSVFTARSGAILKHNSFSSGGLQARRPSRRSRPSPFHDLRHTCASLLISSGAHPKEVCDYLGHSTINITMDRYGHLYPNALAALGPGSTFSTVKAQSQTSTYRLGDLSSV